MPAFFDSRDRQLVIGAAIVMVVLLGLTYVLRPLPAKQAIGTPSSYSTDWLGTKAAFLLLQQSGYRVERWESPPEELPEDAAGTTLIFAEPSERGSGAERAAVSRFVSTGGRLLVMGASGASFAPQSAAIPIPDSDLRQIVVRKRRHWRPSPANAPLWRRTGKPRRAPHPNLVRKALQKLMWSRRRPPEALLAATPNVRRDIPIAAAGEKPPSFPTSRLNSLTAFRWPVSRAGVAKRMSAREARTSRPRRQLRVGGRGSRRTQAFQSLQLFPHIIPIRRSCHAVPVPG